MNFPDLTLLPDVQATADSRRLAIDRVGIRGLKYPMQVVDVDGDPQSTVVEADLSVELDATVKGTHMSRFVALLEGRGGVLSVTGIQALLADMTTLLDARAGRIAFRFPYFVRKAAPVSGVLSVMDYQVTLGGTVRDGRACTTLAIVAPVTSLCPCSKEIAEYGAHNQRSHITIAVRLDRGAAPVGRAARVETTGSSSGMETGRPVAGTLGIGELIRIAEDEASSELYGLLKRPDEKFVTERAYDNPKFVEDLVRDIAARLDRDPRIAGYCVESENFESIHNHSAYAMIRRDFDDA